MKKYLLLLISLILTLCMLTSCFGEGGFLGGIFGDQNSGGENIPNGDEIPDGDEEPDGGEDQKPNEDESVSHLYNSFTPAEKKLFADSFAISIPFMANDEYYVEEYVFEYDDCYEKGINFYTYGNTQAEFEKYRLSFGAYTFEGSEADEYGDTWYFYSFPSLGLYVDMCYFIDSDGNKVSDVYVYRLYDYDDNTGNGGNTGDSGNSGNSGHTYTAFTSSEKALFNQYFGFVIPFIANSDYTVEEYSYDWGEEYGMEVGINFYTYGNTEAEFNAYRNLFSGYSYDGTDTDDYGDAWYYYSNGEYYVDMSYYNDGEGNYVVDVYVYTLGGSGDSDDSDNQGGTGNENQGGSDNTGTGNSYTDFTSSEKALFNQYFGFVIPFIANSDYTVEEYSYDWGEEYGCEVGINFYTYGNTEAEFNAYRNLFSSYSYDGTDTDDYGDAWYYYSKGEYYVDMSYYNDGEGNYVVDVYVYTLSESTGSGGSSGGSDYGDYDVITNEGAGLPTGTNGVYDIDFTDGEYVKDVTDQYYYIDGCPTTGSPAVLVIPIEFTDSRASSKGCNINNIVTAFTGTNLDYYYSVQEYYYISSYGKLDLDVTVIDSWFCPKYSSSYYADLTDSEGYAIGDMVIMDEALAYLSTKMDLSEFDSDNNGIIDAVVMINTLDIGEDDFHWAYRYWNYYVDDQGYYYEYDGVSANDYLWASYFFMQEEFDEEGNASYDNASIINTYTFIHEFGHVLGADDYYDTSYVGNNPLDGCDVMDGMTGDHNPYTKFNYGWITTSRLVTTSSSVTLSLKSFTKTGDSIIIANNWDEKLGAYQEYYIVVYYTMTDLNGGDAGYFSRDGIIVYHVNASLYTEEYEGDTYYSVFNTNTDSSDEYGTENNLIEFVKSAEGNFTYVVGDTMPTVTDDNGDRLIYNFTVDSIDGGSATITVTRN